MFRILVALFLNIWVVSLLDIPGAFKGETMPLDNQELMAQVTALIRMQGLTIVVFDEMYEYSPMSFSSVNGDNQRVLFYDYHTFYTFLGPHMKRVLKITHLEEVRSHLNFLVICGHQCIQSVLDYVTDLDNTIGVRSLLRHFSTWLFISHDSLPHLKTSLDNMAFLWIHLESIKRNQNDKSQQCPNITCGKTREKVVWNYSKVDMFTLLWMPSGREWSPVDLRHVSEDCLYTTVFPNTVRGLNGRQLVLSTIEWRPYTKRHVDNGTVSYRGAGIDVINNLGRKFNFSYMIVEPLDMLWGQKLENGSYTGVVGMISRGEADICPVPYLMSPERKLIMDFSTTVDASLHFAMYRRRSDDAYSWLYLMSNLSWEVYLCGTASLLWILVMFVLANTSTRGTRRFSAYFEIVTHIPFRQDIQNIPEVVSSKAILVTWSIFCMVMTTVYTCNLVAFATVDKHKPPFNTLRELAEQNEYSIGTNEGTYVETLLKNSEDPTVKMLYKKMNTVLTTKGINFSTEARLADTLRRMQEEKFVVISAENVKANIRSQTCDIVTMKESFFPAHSGYVFPRHSPLIKLFNKQFHLLLEMGLMDRMINKWTPAPMKCEISRNLPQLKLDHLKAILVACTVGTVLAAVVLLTEIWKTQKKKTRT